MERLQLVGKLDPIGPNLEVSTLDGSVAIEVEPSCLRGAKVLLAKLGEGINRQDLRKESDPEFAEALVAALDHEGLIARVDKEVSAQPALEVFFELEQELNALVARRIQTNDYWHALLKHPMEVPESVYVGTVLENYHFLKSEPLFDGPALTFPGCGSARNMFNHFYCDELGHDKILRKSLIGAGLSVRQIDDAIPLASTAALINALAYLARFDTLSFFVTIGLLEGRERKIDSFVEACEAKKLSRAFVKPVRAHAMINVKSEHGNVARLLFRELGGIADVQVRRIRSVLPIFVELYNDFYQGIWRHYSVSGSSYLRTLESFQA